MSQSAGGLTILSNQISGTFTFAFTDDITLQPGETITIAATAASGTAGFVTASLNTREDQ